MSNALSNSINEQVFEIMVESATDEQREKLAKLISDWKAKYPRSYASVRDRQPIAFAFMDAVQSADRYVNAAFDVDEGCDPVDGSFIAKVS